MKSIKVIIVAILLVTILVGCSGRDDAVNSSISSETFDTTVQTKSTKAPRTEAVTDMKKENPDTIGWVSVPDTFVDDVVVQSDDNKYYHRLNFQGEYDFSGIYYADFRVDFREGLSELPINTVIYGHAITDNPESESYITKFSSLHNFRNEDYVKEHPYIFFSTPEEDYVFEVFAVFVANADNVDLPYNNPTLTEKQYEEMIANEILPRSIWNYKNIEIAETDKFITLSTCIYELEDGSQTGYPHTWYRMGIMGRLIPTDEAIKETVNVTYNSDAIVDVDTYSKK